VQSYKYNFCHTGCSEAECRYLIIPIYEIPVFAQTEDAKPE